MISLYNLRLVPTQASDRQSGQEAVQTDEVTIGYQTNQGRKMKEGIHPEYREVVFQDMSNDFKFITRSTIQTRETIEFEGATYPLIKIEVSSESIRSTPANTKSLIPQVAWTNSARSSVPSVPKQAWQNNSPPRFKKAATAAFFIIEAGPVCLPAS